MCATLFSRYVREQMFTSNNGDRAGVQNYLVVLTDGRSDNRDATWNQAQEARNEGIHITTSKKTLGILVQLQDSSSTPGYFVLYTSDIQHSLMIILRGGTCAPNLKHNHVILIMKYMYMYPNYMCISICHVSYPSYQNMIKSQN